MITTGIMSQWSRGKEQPLSANDIYMWALSSLRLNKYLEKTILFTDTIGQDILIDKLGLTFDEVRIELDNFIEPELSSLWALGKIKSYSLMDEPFIHVDFDAFLGIPLPEHITNCRVFVQHTERFQSAPKDKTLGYDIPTFLEVCPILPAPMREDLNNVLQIAYNMGVFGGNDLDVIKRYCAEVFKIVEDNKATILEHNDPIGSGLVIFLEQYSLASLAKSYDVEVDMFIETLPWGPQRQKDYWHLFGDKKHNPRYKKRVRDLLKTENPALYDKCLAVIAELNLI